MDVPPKIVGEEVIRRERGVTAHMHADGLPGAPGSLPVLGAFGDFIESERRHSRNRMLVLTGIFTLILILTLGGGVLIGMVLLDKMKVDLDRVQGELDGVRREAQQARNETATAQDRLEGETRSLLGNLSQQEDALARTREVVDAYRADYDRELADMKQFVGLLKTENAALRKDVQLVNSRWPLMVENVNTRLDMSGSEGKREAKSEPMPELPASFDLSILPAGGTRALAWRLPIPE